MSNKLKENSIKRKLNFSNLFKQFHFLFIFSAEKIVYKKFNNNFFKI